MLAEHHVDEVRCTLIKCHAPCFLPLGLGGFELPNPDVVDDVPRSVPRSATVHRDGTADGLPSLNLKDGVLSAKKGLAAFPENIFGNRLCRTLLDFKF